jgi:hypothetical protein
MKRSLSYKWMKGNDSITKQIKKDASPSCCTYEIGSVKDKLMQSITNIKFTKVIEQITIKARGGAADASNYTKKKKTGADMCTYNVEKCYNHVSRPTKKRL